MRDKNISSLVVTDSHNKPAGILTERDLVRKICVNDASSSNIQIKDIMSFPLLTVDATASVREAADIMIQNRVRHLLVQRYCNLCKKNNKRKEEKKNQNPTKRLSSTRQILVNKNGLVHNNNNFICA